MNPKAKTVKLFKDQPEISEADVKRLTKRGFLVAEKSLRMWKNLRNDMTNAQAGEVVSYAPLDKQIQRGIEQADARRLLAIETVRANGRPRKSHIARLLVLAFATDKENVISQIDTISTKLWRKKQK